MTREEARQVLIEIEGRSICLSSKEWKAIDNAIKFLDSNAVWHDCTVVPKYNVNGSTDFIIDSFYGHIEGEAHTYTPDQWSAHLAFTANREFRWAYEKDLIDF